MIRTINETVSFTQEIEEEDLDTFKTAGPINTITIKSHINTIDNLTANFIAFLRALDFMDCQIIEQFENQLTELKERSAFEVRQAQKDTETVTEDDDEEKEGYLLENLLGHISLKAEEPEYHEDGERKIIPGYTGRFDGITESRIGSSSFGRWVE